MCAAGKYSGARAAACADCPAETFLADAATAADAHDSVGDCVACPGTGTELYCAGGGCDACGDCELCTNENQQPTCPATVALGTVAENGGPAAVGSLGCADVDSDFLEYAITAGDDEGRFAAANDVLSVVSDAGLDYEKAVAYTLTIVVTEKYTTEKYATTTTVSVLVGDVNDITLGAIAIAGKATLGVGGGDTVVISGTNFGPLPGAVNPFISDPNVNCADGDQNAYRGTKATSASGAACQAWDVQSPHSHTRTDANFPGSGLDGGHNYCRNPDGEANAWCYTTDPDLRWESCGIPGCGADVVVTATYANGDGATYHAYDCSVTTTYEDRRLC